MMHPPRLVDPADQKLTDLAASFNWRPLAARSAIETAKRVHSAFPPPARTLIGEDAANYLEAFTSLIQADILRQHNRYGSVRWLWYLRRAPDLLFEGSYGTTLGYDRLLAEVVSSLFTATDLSVSSERVAFRVDASAFRHLVQFIGRIKLLSQLHGHYRRVGKGATLDVSIPIFTAFADESVERAIETYDLRQDRNDEFTLPGLGLAAMPFDVRALSNNMESAPSALLSIPCGLGIFAPVTFPDNGGRIVVVNAPVRHLLKQLDVETLLRPMGIEENNPEYLSSVAALIQLLMLVPAICEGIPWALSSIVQRGYFFVGVEKFRVIVEKQLPNVVSKLSPLSPGHVWSTTFTEFRQELEAVVATPWPLSGGSLVRPFLNNLLIDTSGGSRALLHRIELARSPRYGNTRAQLFEIQCQAAIHDTHWRPPADIQHLRGRTLRRNGHAVTDLDAVGVNNRTLLIVSCKSIIYDRAYDKGEFRVVRNVQSTIDEAVTSWEAIAADLIENPVGDNFDFSIFTEILAVVCIPFTAYTNSERSLAFVKTNLRFCSSLIELKEWLKASQT